MIMATKNQEQARHPLDDLFALIFFFCVILLTSFGSIVVNLRDSMDSATEMASVKTVIAMA